MIINCPNCNIKYSINKNILGKNRKKVKGVGYRAAKSFGTKGGKN